MHTQRLGPIGLLAGNGQLPVQFARYATAAGYQVVAVGVTPGVVGALTEHAAHFTAVPMTQWQRIIDTLTAAGVGTVYMFGSIPKQTLLDGQPLDERMQRVIRQAVSGGDHALFEAFAADLAAEGITVAQQHTLLPDLVAQPGLLTARAPSEAEQKDITVAFRVAKKLTGLDIGQTVVAKGGAVLAVEAIEGTDAVLRRGAALGGGDVVAVKVSYPHQDMRFDVPTIGPATVRTMIDTGVRVLACEPYRTLILNKDEMIRLADAHELTLLALDKAYDEEDLNAHYDVRR